MCAQTCLSSRKFLDLCGLPQSPHLGLQLDPEFLVMLLQLLQHDLYFCTHWGGINHERDGA